MATRKTITVKEPTKRETKDAAKQVRKGHPSGAKVMDDRKVAKSTPTKKPTK